MLGMTRSLKRAPFSTGPAAWIAVLLLSAPLLAGAAVSVSFTSSDLPDVGGQHFRAYEYVISGGFVDGYTLTLEFPVAAYGDPITVLQAPTLLTLSLLQPVPGPVPFSGLLMLTAFTPPASFQDTLRVSFLSLAAPGPQPFEVADSNFGGLVVQQGSTTDSATAAVVPEPPAGALFAAGLALLAVLKRSPFSRCRSPH